MKILSDAADFMSGGTPNKANPAFWGGDIPWYSASNMTDRFIGNGSPKITYEGLIAGSKMAPKGSTLILVRGSGLFNYIPICYVEKEVSFNQDVKAICPKDDTDPVFLHFWMESLRNTLNQNLGVTGIGAGKLDTDFLKNLPFPDLSRKKQEYIAQYAQSFDRKIDLNRRMNETLETMARALFRDWFVDFGPTRAKMAGEAPYLAPELWELFPDKLDDEGKPEGWQTESLDETATFLNGLALQKYPATGDTSLPAIKIAQLRSESTDTADPVSPDIPDNYIVEQNDLLFSWSGSLLCKFWNGQRGALNQHLFKVTSKRFEPWFIYEWIQFYMPEFQAIAAAKATTMGHIQRRHLTESLVTIPPANIMQAANKAIGSLIVQIQSNNGQSRTLAQLRDLLLPKLMSGEISIRDAEKMVEDVA